MKVFISSSTFGSAHSDESVEFLCRAVKAAKLRDFSFFRDVKDAKEIKNQQELWSTIYDELAACDGFLIDVTDDLHRSKIVELGMAYAMRKSTIVVKKFGVKHDPFIEGIASNIIEYTDGKDLANKLKAYDDERVFGTTDTFVMLGTLLLLGGFMGYMLAQIWIVAGVIVPILYWLLLRKLFAQIRAYDRLVVYIPIIFVWLSGFFWLKDMYMTAALAWLITYWIVALFILKKLKLSL